jgi:hypothetical protein
MDDILNGINNALGNPVTQQAGKQTIDIAGQASTITPIQTIGKLVEIGAGAILVIGAIAVLMYLLLGALNWITSGGDKGKVESARTMITQAIIGLVILASVFAVYGLVLRALGISSISVSGVKGAPKNGNSTTNSQNGCTVGQRFSDGGAGGYCTGSAEVVCVAAGKGPSKFSYAHYEPCKCLSGEKKWAWQSTCN